MSPHRGAHRSKGVPTLPGGSGGAGESRTLRGVSLSPGVAIGPAHLVWQGVPDAPEYCITPDHLEGERERFLVALEKARQELGVARRHLAADTGHPEMHYLLEAHRLILEDPTLREGVFHYLALGCNAEWAVKQHLAGLLAAFDDIADSYLQEKRLDVAQVGRLLLRTLLGHTEEAWAQFPHPVILVAESFSPADTLLMKSDTVLGFVTEVGGRTSHSAILAKSLGLPAVGGVSGLTHQVQDGDQLVVDGLTGLVHINPPPGRLKELVRQRSGFRAFQKELAVSAQGAAQTLDGHRVGLMANVNFLADAKRARRLGADGVGLYRTEHLYLNRSSLPGEELIVRACRRVMEAMPGRLVTLRTLDLGGEKSTPLLCDQRPGPHRSPPWLRAIRLCLQEARSTLLTQLRAFLRVSVHGPVRILFPMVSGPGELEEILGILGEARSQLAGEGVPMAEGIPVGIMVEVPAAALCADLLAKKCDFFSIGTNDLVQYTLATDRLEESEEATHGCTHPAVLRLIAMTVEAARRQGIPVGVCGEMASDPRYAFLLTGMGVDELSVSPRALPLVRHTIRGVGMEDARQAARDVLAGVDGGGVAGYLEGRLIRLLGAGHVFQGGMSSDKMPPSRPPRPA